MRKSLEVNVKKIILMYSLGFITAIFMPQKIYFKIMNTFHSTINKNMIVHDKGDFYKIK
jgi:hypothetical protein